MLAQQDGTRVLALSLRHAGAAVRATIRVLAPSGRPVDGLKVSLGGGVAATSCGHGCYHALLHGAGDARRIQVRVRTAGGATTLAAFRVPRRWPVSAAAVVNKADRVLRGARSLVYRDRLESAPGRQITTIWRVVAPDRLTYSINDGAAAVVIGDRRWDREAGTRRWIRSSQDPSLDLPALPWGSHVEDVYVLDPPPALRDQDVEVAMYDPSTPAWYDVTFRRPSLQIRSVRMVAPSHFMLDDYLAYDPATRIRAPIAR
jgi:hypothetical protein